MRSLSGSTTSPLTALTRDYFASGIAKVAIQGSAFEAMPCLCARNALARLVQGLIKVGESRAHILETNARDFCLAQLFRNFTATWHISRWQDAG